VNAPNFPQPDNDDFIDAPSRSDYSSPEQLLLYFRARHSIRLYKTRSVEEETLRGVIDAGRYAPTAQNRQALRYTALNRPEKMENLRRLTIDVLTAQADILDEALTKEERDGIQLSPAERLWRDYPPLWRSMAQLRDPASIPSSTMRLR